ncbi:NAD(P)H-hydrate dehydratase [Halosquirtibacter xylanolyticus]|uniref:NAD(P)H-hydrate dehydratase n=1 Tax=Halosquirtibacter xylanolyticus TaxID=3374599 RepID=UPI0037480ED1|nr:NAD(P)H-hydrate dehydratase [Prolixibacteraceae bacterium]
MKIWRSPQIEQWDRESCAKQNISSVELMYRAASRWTTAFTQKYSLRYRCILFIGPGNNGGDGLVVAMLLDKLGYEVEIVAGDQEVAKSKDARFYYDEVRAMTSIKIVHWCHFEKDQDFDKSTVLIDGLFGIGLSRPLSGIYKDMVLWVNGTSLPIAAIDIPSGLFADKETPRDAHIVCANDTWTFEIPKASLFFSENSRYVGNLSVVSIGLSPDMLKGESAQCDYVDIQLIRKWLFPVHSFSHKGSKGHALVIAGSEGMMGAAILAAKGALSGGCGLVTSHIPNSYEILMHLSCPEVLVSVDESNDCFSSVPCLERYSAVAVGPGLGQGSLTVHALETLIEQTHVPMVLDADALNIMSEYPDLLKKLPKGSILTPHPKEFERLLGVCESSWERIEKARFLAVRGSINILIKGKNSVVVDSSGRWSVNDSGGPVLSKGGSGDVLTGLIVSLLANGYAPDVALRMGVWIHGKAGDVFAERGDNQSLNVSDLPQFIGVVWEKLVNSSSK